MIKRVILGLAIVATICGCATETLRETGQNELFRVDPQTFDLSRTLPSDREISTSFTKVDREVVDPGFGDLIKYNDDVVVLQVPSIYLHHLPITLTGSRDIVVFAEVWENAASGYGVTPLHSIICIARNQMIPGRLSCEGNLGYGPTIFKGHPAKIRFTVMILQKEQGAKMSSAADTIGNLATAATMTTPFSPLVSGAAGIIRDVLRAQPDVIALDFEFTALSRSPAGLKSTILAQGEDANASANISVASTETALNAVIATAGPNTAVAANAINTKNNLESAKRGFTDAASKLNATDRKSLNIEDPHVLWSMPEKTRTKQVNELVSTRTPDSEALERADKDLAQAVARAQSTVQQVQPPSGKTSLEERWPWLRYGVYAVIETAARRQFVQEGEGSQEPFRLGFDDRIRFDSGWLFRVPQETGGATQAGTSGPAGAGPRIPLETNYLVFSLTPHQLTETDEVLRAASQANEKLLVDLRQNSANLKAASETIKSFGQQLVRQIGEGTADDLARMSAMNLKQANQLTYENFAQTFGSSFDTSMGKLDDDHAGSGSAEWLKDLKDRILNKWKIRIKAAGISG